MQKARSTLPRMRLTLAASAAKMGFEHFAFDNEFCKNSSASHEASFSASAASAAKMGFTHFAY